MNTTGYDRKHPGAGVYNPVNINPLRMPHGLLPPNIASSLYQKQSWRVRGYKKATMSKSAIKPKAHAASLAKKASYSAQYGRGRSKKAKKAKHTKKKMSEFSGSFEL